MFLTVVNPNNYCELLTSPEASFVVIFRMAAISDTQMIDRACQSHFMGSNNFYAINLILNLHFGASMPHRYTKYLRPPPLKSESDFRRQNLSSVDVRFWRLKSITTL